MDRIVSVPEWTKDSWEQTFGRMAPTRLLENWPEGKRLAVLLTFDTQGDIDAARPGYQTTMRRDGSINYVDQMERQYEIHAGLKRIIRILDENGVKATFPTCGSTADWYPDVVKLIPQSGHELAVHSYAHWAMHSMSGDELTQEIRRATDAIERIAGHRVVGWRSPQYTTTGDTLDGLIEAGYEWDASYPNSDLPFWIERPSGKRILALPACLDDSNMYLMPVSSYTTHAGGNFYASPQHVLNSWRCEFDVLYKESAVEPRICSLTMHPRVSGRPFRSWALEQFIQHASSHPGVWFATCGELAQVCV